MIELLTSMWAYLAGAGVIGLILGWAFRGAFVPRPKTVTVSAPQPAALERPLTEAQQQLLERAEADAVALQSAQSQLQELQATVADLRAKAEQSDIAAAPQQLIAEPPPAPAAPEISAEEEEARQRAVWHERYLASRVRHLEGKIAELEAAPAPPPVAPAAPAIDISDLHAEIQSLKTRAGDAEAGLASAESRLADAEAAVADREAKLADAETRATAAVANAAPAEDAHEAAAKLARTEWQNRYLRARILHVESAADRSEEAPAEAVSPDVENEINTLKSEVTVLKAELARETQGSGASEQELARLRWRNRYLEGRLKYLEAASLDAEAAADADIPVDIAALSAPVTAAPAQEAPVEPSEPVEEVRPPSLDAPNGQADDLKRIGGIGPKIELILNELGVFHYAQIAAWTPGEEAWIDSYLRFQGRVMREKWVDQASSLAAA